MKDRVDPAAPAASRRQHPIALDNDYRDSTREKLSLSPLSPTLSEASSASSSSPVPSSRKYARKEKIGQGAQGSVYRCVEVATGRELAVKVIITHELSAAEVEAIKREVRTIKKLQHENLVTYYKATEKKAKHLSIYMEYVAGGSLSARLRHGGALPLATTKKYTRQLCEALRNLHENGIAHRDVKCANVFLTYSTESIKLGDFGAFKEVGSVSLVGGLKGTPHWMAPEIIRAEQQTSEDGWFKADIWSLGCTVIEMLTGHSPWQQYSNPLTAMYQIVSSNKTPTIPADATEETASFLSLCLQRNPEERASIHRLLNHDFVQLTGDDQSESTIGTMPASTLVEARDNQEKPVGNQPECNTPKLKMPRTQSLEKQDEQPQRDASPLKARQEDPGKPQHEPASVLTSPHPPSSSSSTRGSIRKPSVVPRLKPLELLHSPNNQEKESHDERRLYQPAPPATAPKPQAMSRGVSAGALGPSMAGLEPTKPSSRPGLVVRPVRLRRLSTAPAPSRETEEILSCVPPAQKLKLPPLSARPSTGSSAIER